MTIPVARHCWIGAGLAHLIEARVREISANGAVVLLAVVSPVPEECNLFFTSDCKVGRKCVVVRQEDSEVVLLFEGRIGPAELPDGPGPGGSSDVIEID